MRLKFLLISLSIILPSLTFAQVRSDLKRTTSGALGHHTEEASSKEKVKDLKGSVTRSTRPRGNDSNNGLENFVLSDKPTNLSIDRTKIHDYVMYRQVVRRHSWYEGVGEPITQDVADKLPLYYRLSMKNKAGHYQFVEAMHGSRLTTDHPKSPLLIDKTYQGDDDVSRAGWREKLASVGQWMFTSDLSGEEMIEERAYEANMTDARLIYAFQCVKMDSIHVNGCYVTSNGLPIDINESDEYNYGNLVRITYAANGTDSIAQFYDSKGFYRPSDTGIYQIRYQYDDKLRLRSLSYHNLAGDYMNDVNGLCRTEYIYDGDGFDYTISLLDKDGNPYYETEGPFRGLSRYRFKHDGYGRIIELETLVGRTDDKTGLLICPAGFTFTYSPTGEVLTSDPIYDDRTQTSGNE